MQSCPQAVDVRPVTLDGPASAAHHMLQGFTPPYSATGRSSLVPPPPCHYAGRIVSAAVELDADAAQGFLPPVFGRATGRAFGHFCEWQATTDGSELVDPAYALYDEFFLLLEAQDHGAGAAKPSTGAASSVPAGPRLFCPFIYVTQDISMVRGLMQGWPKKLASVRIARSYGLDHPAAAPLRAGTRLGASCAVKDRRVAEAEWTYTGEAGARLGFLSIPTFGLVGSPTLVGGADRGSPRLVRQAVAATVIGSIHAAEGELRLFGTPHDELGALAPRRTTAVASCEFALTVTGAIEADR